MNICRTQKYRLYIEERWCPNNIDFVQRNIQGKYIENFLLFVLSLVSQS